MCLLECGCHIVCDSGWVFEFVCYHVCVRVLLLEYVARLCGLECVCSNVFDIMCLLVYVG